MPHRSSTHRTLRTGCAAFVAVGLVTLLDGVVGACFVVAFFVTAGAEPGMLASAGAERTLVMLGE